MNFQFSNVSFLWALFGISIPIIFHFLRSKIFRPIPFSATQFLTKIHKKALALSKIKKIWLLIMRLFFWIFITLAFAMPIFKEQLPAAMNSVPKNVMIVFDRTFSMNYGSHIETAKKKAISYIQSLSADDQVGLIFLGKNQGHIDDYHLTSNHQYIVKAIQDTKSFYVSHTWEESLSSAYHLLQQGKSRAPALENQLVIVSDFFYPEDSLVFQQKPNEVMVLLLDISDDNPIPSEVSVSKVTSEQKAHSFITHTTEIELSIEITRISSTSEFHPASFAVHVIDDETDNILTQGTIVFESQKQIIKKLRFETGTFEFIKMRIQIFPDASIDGETKNNIYYHQSYIYRPVSLLIVNGEQNSTYYKNENYFVEEALRHQTSGHAPVKYQTITEDQFLAMNDLDMFEYDTIMLMNCGNIDSRTITNVGEFLKKGKGVFYSAGVKIHTENSGPEILSLFDMSVRALKTNISDSVNPYIHHIDYEHPILQIFRTNEGKGFTEPAIQTLLLFDHSSTPYRSLLSLYQNVPLFIEPILQQQGKALVFASTLDNDWNDIPLYPAYLPLIQRSIHYLANNLEEPQHFFIFAGDSIDRNTDFHDKPGFSFVNQDLSRKKTSASAPITINIHPSELKGSFHSSEEIKKNVQNVSFAVIDTHNNQEHPWYLWFIVAAFLLFLLEWTLFASER